MGASKKVLVITYYWPPSGGSGVQRWLKFVKYLPQFGWEPVVFAPENPSFALTDPSLQQEVSPTVEVVHFPIWEPYELFFRLRGKSVQPTDFVSKRNNGMIGRLSRWVRAHVFIPDARMFWVRPSVQFLHQFIRERSIDIVITTGPPHSVHLIGLRLKQKNPSLKWLADFRDPWSEWDLLDELGVARWARKIHQRLERKVLQQADQVITIAPYHAHRFALLGARPVRVITNGFDETDFAGVQHTPTNKFVVRHMGVVDALRDPWPFIEALNDLVRQHPACRSLLSVEFVGNVNTAFKEKIWADGGLAGIVMFVEQVPHSQLLQLYGTTNLQLLVLAHSVLAPGNLPGKFFEYLASGNPILAIGPTQGDAADVLRQTGAGRIFERTQRAEIAQFLWDQFSAWQQGSPPAPRDVSAYTRRKLTEQLSEVLDGLQA